MPVVVVEWCVRVAFDEVSTVSQVRNIMQVTVQYREKKSHEVFKHSVGNKMTPININTPFIRESMAIRLTSMQ